MSQLVNWPYPFRYHASTTWQMNSHQLSPKSNAMHQSTNLLIPISSGELVDKITILKLKLEHLEIEAALTNVRRELLALEAVLDKAPWQKNTEIAELTSKLLLVNSQLWEVEDQLRLHENEKRFDAEFIALARSVYKLNDQRALLKRTINEHSGSMLKEEKSYGEF